MFEPEVFIDLVKARPPLYNSSLLDYKSKPICSILWQEIADALNKDVNKCKTVWARFRSSYARHLQNMENNVKGINRRVKAPWYLADKMSFLNEFMTRTPHDRNLTINHEDPNNSTASASDNSISFSNFEYKSDNNCTMDDSHSIVTIKSEESDTDMTLSCLEEIINERDYEDVEETKSPSANCALEKCRVELTSTDQNIPATKRNQNEIQTEPPEVSVTKRFKMSSDEPSLTSRAEIENNAKEREISTLLFFKSILFDIRKLSDRKLRFFKQDILQDLNKYLDEDEHED